MREGIDDQRNRAVSSAGYSIGRPPQVGGLCRFKRSNSMRSASINGRKFFARGFGPALTPRVASSPQFQPGWLFFGFGRGKPWTRLSGTCCFIIFNLTNITTAQMRSSLRGSKALLDWSLKDIRIR